MPNAEGAAMAKPRSRTLDLLVYLAVRVAVCVLQMLTPRAAYRLADGLAWLAYRLDRRHRLVADDNLAHAFPGRHDGRQRDELVRAVYRHFCTLLVDVVHAPRKLHPVTWRRYLDLAGGRAVVEALLAGRPVMLVTGHFGNWEMGGFLLGLLGFRTYAIARTLDNPHLDRFLRSFREHTGQGILSKDGDFGRIQAVLAANGVLGTLADQDAGPRGLFVDFFGRPASTHKAVALLSLEYNVPLLVIGVPRVGSPMRYTVQAEDLIRPEEYAGRPDAVKAITQRYTAALERLVRRAPEQYFWLHRRWKHQPQARRKPRQAA
jgi:KDO2-lipid IV(A) lauroyltransferase